MVARFALSIWGRAVARRHEIHLRGYQSCNQTVGFPRLSPLRFLFREEHGVDGLLLGGGTLLDEAAHHHERAGNHDADDDLV